MFRHCSGGYDNVLISGNEFLTSSISTGLSSINKAEPGSILTSCKIEDIFSDFLSQLIFTEQKSSIDIRSPHSFLKFSRVFVSSFLLHIANSIPLLLHSNNASTYPIGQPSVCGVCQGSCRVVHFYAAFFSCRCGFRSTAPTGVQLRVAPDQREGFFFLAAS